VRTAHALVTKISHAQLVRRPTLPWRQSASKNTPPRKLSSCGAPNIEDYSHQDIAFDFRTANMGMPALKLDQENTVEESIEEIKERLVRVEMTVKHIQDGVSELKADVRHLDQKIDAVEQKIETVEH